MDIDEGEPMNISDDPKVKAVNWFLDFLADDLDNMSDLDFSKRVVEIVYYFLYLWLWPKAIPWEGTKAFIGLAANHPSKDNLKSIQADLKQLMKEVTELQRFPPGSLLDTDRIVNFSDKGFSVSICTLKADWEFFIEQDTMTLAFRPPDSASTLNDLEELKNAATMSLLSALSGLPTGSIRSCAECGRYFLHLSKKPKYYCSPKCGSRNLSRKRREADPDAYRAKQREIMRKKYREKKAKELGKPIDKVKIQERAKKK